MKSSRKIQDHGIIGDGRSAALVTTDGTVDWLCWPRFDSPALFGSILDEHVGGFWGIRPRAPSNIRRGYLDQTNVFETRFENDGGTIVLTDFMPAASEEQKQRMLIPEHELIRRVRCERGECNLQIQFAPRCDYGRHR